MGSTVVVAGVSSLYMAVPVEGFPVGYESVRYPSWLRCGVSGVAAHVADVLRRLGDEVRLCTLVGQDPAGVAIRHELGLRGLLGSGVVTGPPTSSLGVVLVAPDGQRMGNAYLSSVNAAEYPVEVFAEAVRGADLAVLTNVGFVRPLLAHARRSGVPVAVDVHVIADVNDEYNRPWLDIADVVFCSHERLPCSPSQWIARVFDRFPGCLIVGVGQGARGCVVGLRDGRLIEVPAIAPRGVVNTSGAGDALFASFVHGWLATGNPIEALESAVLHVAWKIGEVMPSATSLTEAELERLRRVHSVRPLIGRWSSGESGTESVGWAESA